MSRIRMTRRPGQPGTKKLMRQYGEDLVCVRYRYDEELRQRIKTVEIAIDRAKWSVRTMRDDSEMVYFRIAEGEDLLRRAVLLAGGRWDESTGVWHLSRRDAKGRWGCCPGFFGSHEGQDYR